MRNQGVCKSSRATQHVEDQSKGIIGVVDNNRFRIKDEFSSNNEKEKSNNEVETLDERAINDIKEHQAIEVTDEYFKGKDMIGCWIIEDECNVK